MESKAFDAPALFGDHHVSEVQRILKELPGIEEIYASSAFQAIEVSFDEKQVSAEEIAARLEETGYLGEMPILAETGIAVEKKEGDGIFRHTATYATVKKTISFAQRVQYEGRPLWHCPGMGTVRMDE